MKEPQILGLLIIDLLDTAMYLQDIYGKYFTTPELGIYSKNSHRSILTPGNTYALEDTSNFHFNGIMESIKSDIYDEYGFRLVSHKGIIDGLYSHEPSLPVCEIGYIYEAVKETIDNCVEHNEVPGHCLEEYINPRYEAADVVKILASKVYPITDKVLEFIGKDVWNIYDVQLNGTTLYIAKKTDYRIMGWYRNLEAKDEE